MKQSIEKKKTFLSWLKKFVLVALLKHSNSVSSVLVLDFDHLMRRLSTLVWSFSCAKKYLGSSARKYPGVQCECWFCPSDAGPLCVVPEGGGAAVRRVNRRDALVNASYDSGYEMLCRPPIKSRRPGSLTRLIALSWASNTSMGSGITGTYLLTCSLTDPSIVRIPRLRLDTPPVRLSQSDIATEIQFLFFFLALQFKPQKSLETTAKMADICPLQSIVNCTVTKCPLSCAQVDYQPTLAGNTVYAAAFGLLLIAQLGLGIKYKTWGFMVGMICGLVLEVVGYAGRIMLHDNPFNFNNFIIYLVPLTIAPAFIAGALYLCLSRIVIVYGQNISRFSPRAYAIVFMASDFVSLVLQGTGGGIAATADDHSGSERGRAIMVAGVVFQLVSLLIFMGVGLEFVSRLRRTTVGSARDIRFAQLRDTKKFTWFQYALGAAVVLVFIRSVYRVAELQQGFDGPIANDEVSFMILEGPMIFLAVLAMTALHPGFGLGGQWSSAAWSIKQSRKAAFAMSGSSIDGIHM
ncbi:hypothetical protein LA080_005885 [Diaporthe eres]|nr:hypothetical protein LA080_005885 [Diaporthe eres]